MIKPRPVREVFSLQWSCTVDGDRFWRGDLIDSSLSYVGVGVDLQSSKFTTKMGILRSVLYGSAYEDILSVFSSHSLTAWSVFLYCPITLQSFPIHGRALLYCLQFSSWLVARQSCYHCVCVTGVIQAMHFWNVFLYLVINFSNANCYGVCGCCRTVSG